MDELLGALARDLPSSPLIVRSGHGVHVAGRQWADPADLLDNLPGLCDDVMEIVVGGAWPRCPVHGRHPLEPGAGGWECPHSGGGWGFGTLADHPLPPESNVPDDHVRWWSDARGWGVVAHRDGDIFVHFSMIEGEGYRQLREGQRVEVRLGRGRQGLFRQAASVRVVEGRRVPNRTRRAEAPRPDLRGTFPCWT